VCHGTEGNPLFLEERFSSLVETGALARHETAWRFDRTLSGEVPEALERLFCSRVDRLTTGARDAIVAASVLGPDFGVGALRAVTDLNGGLASAVSELCSGGLIVEVRKDPEPSYRFRHSLIQEATYRGLLREQRQRLHARAAWGLEEQWAGRLEDVAGTLGHHFALADEPGRAVHYLEQAGDHAASAFANEEAVTSYRYALDILAKDGNDSIRNGSDATIKTEIELRLKIALVLMHIGRFAEAREILQEGLRAVGTSDEFLAARLYNRLARVEFDGVHDYDAALRAFEAASERFGTRPQDLEPGLLDVWLDTRLGMVMIHYWRDKPDQMPGLLDEIRPVLETEGVRRGKRARYHSIRVNWQLTERRHRVDEQILAEARQALAAAEESGEYAEHSSAVFGLGFCLLWYGDLDGAEKWLTDALRMHERSGSSVGLALCTCYLNLAALRRHDPDAVALLAPRAMEAAYAASRPQYAATAKASLAWLAWKTGRLSEVEDLAHEALASWPANSWQPFHWVCLWPLIAARLAEGQVAGAVDAGRQLLPAPQQRLPDELEAEVNAAIEAWERDEPERAGEILAVALELAQRLRYA
jgi:eukaryotic-like serine/threonine-protein kinase